MLKRVAMITDFGQADAESKLVLIRHNEQTDPKVLLSEYYPTDQFLVAISAPISDEEGVDEITVVDNELQLLDLDKHTSTDAAPTLPA